LEVPIKVKEFDPVNDIAFLEITRLENIQISPYPLTESVIEQNEFASYGFWMSDSFEVPLSSTGRILGKTKIAELQVFL